MIEIGLTDNNCFKNQDDLFFEKVVCPNWAHNLRLHDRISRESMGSIVLLFFFVR